MLVKGGRKENKQLEELWLLIMNLEDNPDN